MESRTPDWPPPPVLGVAGIEVREAHSVDAVELFTILDLDEVWEHVAGRPRTSDELATTLVNAAVLGRFPRVILQHGRMVGTTSFLDVSPPDLRLEIGHTAYAPSVWGSVVNPAAKFALMNWAFEAGFTRVQFKTDVRNLRSRRAIAALGAHEEGVLRRYQRRADGTIRDTVMFSVLADEWPTVRDRLTLRLGRS